MTDSMVNGGTVTDGEQADVAAAAKPTTKYSIPEASTRVLHEAIEKALNEIVSEATNQVSRFMLHARWESGTDLAVKLGHLVDATECLEIAMTHLGQLKSTVSYRLRMQDAENIDPDERPF